MITAHEAQGDEAIIFTDPVADAVAQQSKSWLARARQSNVRPAVPVVVENREATPSAGVVDPRDARVILEVGIGDAPKEEVISFVTAPRNAVGNPFEYA